MKIRSRLDQPNSCFDLKGTYAKIAPQLCIHVCFSGRSKMSSKNNKSVKNLPAFSLDTSFLNTPPKKDADRSSAGVSTYFDVRDESHILDV